MVGMQLRPETNLSMNICSRDIDVFKVQHGDEEVFKDDLTGQMLDTELVREARRKELEYFAAKNVWTLRPIAEARKATGKPPITVRWVDVNKGDDVQPNIRSRVVAQ